MAALSMRIFPFPAGRCMIPLLLPFLFFTRLIDLINSVSIYDKSSHSVLVSDDSFLYIMFLSFPACVFIMIFR